jgi:hypothetical protein
LKKKIVELKNKEWVKGVANAKLMEARPILPQQGSEPTLKINSEDSKANSEEFQKALAENGQFRKQKTVDLLNGMFTNDRDSPNATLLVKNQTKCNTILQIESKKKYDLAVQETEKTIVLPKDKYTLIGNICGSRYEQVKDLNKGLILTLKL